VIFGRAKRYSPGGMSSAATGISNEAKPFRGPSYFDKRNSIAPAQDGVVSDYFRVLMYRMRVDGLFQADLHGDSRSARVTEETERIAHTELVHMAHFPQREARLHLCPSALE
jgi:hypothetical protein